MKDPKKLKEQRPDYVKDPTGTGGQDRPSVIGSDPESLPRTGDREVPAPERQPSERDDDAS